MNTNMEARNIRIPTSNSNIQNNYSGNSNIGENVQGNFGFQGDINQQAEIMNSYDQQNGMYGYEHQFQREFDFNGMPNPQNPPGYEYMPNYDQNYQVSNPFCDGEGENVFIQDGFYPTDNFGNYSSPPLNGYESQLPMNRRSTYDSSMVNMGVPPMQGTVFEMPSQNMTSFDYQNQSPPIYGSGSLPMYESNYMQSPMNYQMTQGNQMQIQNHGNSTFSPPASKPNFQINTDPKMNSIKHQPTKLKVGGSTFQAPPSKGKQEIYMQKNGASNQGLKLVLGRQSNKNISQNQGNEINKSAPKMNIEVTKKEPFCTTINEDKNIVIQRVKFNPERDNLNGFFPNGNKTNLMNNLDDAASEISEYFISDNIKENPYKKDYKINTNIKAKDVTFPGKKEITLSNANANTSKTVDETGNFTVERRTDMHLIVSNISKPKEEKSSESDQNNETDYQLDTDAFFELSSSPQHVPKISNFDFKPVADNGTFQPARSISSFASNTAFKNSNVKAAEQDINVFVPPTERTTSIFIPPPNKNIEKKAEKHSLDEKEAEDGSSSEKIVVSKREKNVKELQNEFVMPMSQFQLHPDQFNKVESQPNNILSYLNNYSPQKPLLSPIMDEEENNEKSELSISKKAANDYSGFTQYADMVISSNNNEANNSSVRRRNTDKSFKVYSISSSDDEEYEKYINYYTPVTKKTQTPTNQQKEKKKDAKLFILLVFIVLSLVLGLLVKLIL